MAFGWLDSPLKGCVENVQQIPEANKDHALARILTRINKSETPFFTVGCVSAPVSGESGHRVTGYVEISFNDAQLVADAVNYFAIFWRFTNRLKQTKSTERVTLHWELQGASFLDVNCVGMTCSIIVNTHFSPTPEEARTCWTNVLEVLGDELESTQDFEVRMPIY